MMETNRILENNLKLIEGVEHTEYKKDFARETNIDIIYGYLPPIKNVLPPTSFEHRGISSQMLEENNGRILQDYSSNLHSYTDH